MTLSTPSAERILPYAALLSRVTLGGFFLAHAGLKLLVFTPAGTAAYFGSLGLPSGLAYAVIAAEIVGGLALILGVATRWAALALVPILLGALIAVHAANGFFFTAQGGGAEFPLLWIVALLVQAALGDGAFALGSAAGGRTLALSAR